MSARTPVLVRFPPALLQAVDRERGPLNRHAFLIDLIERAVTARAPSDTPERTVPHATPDAGESKTAPSVESSAAVEGGMSAADLQETAGPDPVHGRFPARTDAKCPEDAPAKSSDPPATAGTSEEREGPSGPDGDATDAQERSSVPASSPSTFDEIRESDGQIGPGIIADEASAGLGHQEPTADLGGESESPIGLAVPDLDGPEDLMAALDASLDTLPDPLGEFADPPGYDYADDEELDLPASLTDDAFDIGGLGSGEFE